MVVVVMSAWLVSMEEISASASASASASSWEGRRVLVWEDGAAAAAAAALELWVRRRGMRCGGSSSSGCWL